MELLCVFGRFDVEGYVIGFGSLDWVRIYEFVECIVLVI